ncbi:MAG: tyrosine-type recombinase/integrase, partial [Paracoccaceae bacterium]|nr:tyrosine-type recombinase/integrase [Paracoccaceae bacterium]
IIADHTIDLISTVLFPQCFPMTLELNFTDAWLKKLKPSSERQDFRDRSTRGLQLRNTTNGVKTFSFAFRLGLKTGRVTIGKYPDIDLKFARHRVDHMRGLIAQGIDPRREKDELKEKAKMTVDAMASMFIEKYAKPRNKSWKQAESNLRLYLIPELGQMPIAAVKRSDIHEILDDLISQEKFTAANRALAHIKKFFGWLVERGYLENSPADHIKSRFKEQRRERVLSDNEIRALWIASESMSAPYKSWIRLLLLCGQRRVETACLRRSQLQDDCWNLQGADTKNKQSHVVPLSNQAKAIMDDLLQTEGEYLFKTGRIGDAPINGFSKAKAQMDELSGITDWRWHDLRAAVGTNITKLGYDRLIMQRIINHKDGSVTAAYDLYSYLNEKRAALQSWADRLDEICA